MSDDELAVSHIDQLEKRLASLHDLGVDTAGLRSQLAFARTQVHEGRITEALGICEEVAVTARRLADGSGPTPERPRTGRFTRDQLAEAVKDLLSQGLLAKLMAEQRSGPDLRLEARLNTFDENVRTYIGHEADALRTEQQVLRAELEQLRRSVGNSASSGATTPISQPQVATEATEPEWAMRLHGILVESIRRADAQAAEIASIVRHLTETGANASGAQALTARVAALRSGIAEDLRAVVDHAPAPSPESDPAAGQEPAWAQTLGSTLQAVAERLQNQPVPLMPNPDEPAWSHGLCAALDAVAARLCDQPLTLMAEPPTPTEPEWSLALREALAGAEARHHELLAALAARTSAEPGDGRLGDQLASAFERGLHDLGALLAQQHADSAPQPMDDSRGALNPITMSDQQTTSATTTRTDPVVSPELLRKLVEHAVEVHLGMRNTAAIANKDAGIDDIRALIAAELDVRQGGAVERTGHTDLADLRSAVLRLLPDLLGDEAVRHRLFAVLALEAVSKPGALGELTGLRAFLRRELSRVAEELATKFQPA